ncbi:hypothetical protein ACIA8O_34955 [Kitasatospora sp. NPDC051853]|uniref:hypothetical protein n=1 Tax=Kitasatospora sp. NPDC051853 TaxID=3364058 RepID=UPI00378C8E7A
MAGQNNCTDGPGPGELTDDGEEFDLLTLIAQLTERAAREPGHRLSSAAVGRALSALVELTLPEGVLITTPEEYERARESAYAQGWQDAVQHLHRQPAVTGPAPSVPPQAQHAQAQQAQQASARPRPESRAQEPRAQQPQDRTPAEAGTGDQPSGTEATVLAFPPRIPLVRAADSDGRRELMPHRPRRPSRRRRESPKPPKAPRSPDRPDEPGA